MPAAKQTPTFKVSYAPKLIDKLLEEHQTLIEQMTFLEKLARAQKYDTLQIAFEVFRATVLEHVSKEILKLYVYLHNSLKNQPQQYSQMRDFRKEMDSIVDTILHFLNEYRDIGQAYMQQNPHLQQKFPADLKQVIAIFTHRIEAEEQILFPLYQKKN